MYKALTLPRTRKQAVVEDPSSSITVLSLKPTLSLSPNTIRRRRGGKSKLSATTSDGSDGGSNATPVTGNEARSNRSAAVAGSHSLPSRSSPKTAKKKLNSILKGGRNLIFKNRNESAPLEAEKSLDFHRVASVRVATMRSSKSNHDETDVAVGAPLSSTGKDPSSPPPPPDDWSVSATCERVKKISVIESVYRDGTVTPDNDVRSITSDQDVFSDATPVSSPTPESSDFSLPWSSSHRQTSTSALKEEILRKTTCDHAAYIWSKVDNKERMINGQDRSASNKNDLLFKILVIGELGTGKTSIIKRYVHQFFSQHYRATIGVDFALKVLAWDTNTTIRLQLWDIAGQERFGNMTRVYYKEAVGALIVFDVTRQGTFDAVNKWKQDLDSKVQLPDGEAIPCVLLANKCDQPKEGIVNNQHKMDEFCKENQFVGWFETSAKENVNIDEAANCLVSKIIQNDMKRHLERETVNGTGVISIELDKKDSKRKFCNFC